MSSSNLLDDEIISENLAVEIIIQHSKKIAQRVLFLAIFFCVFSLVGTIITYTIVFGPRGSGSNVLISIAILSAQLGSFFITFRLFGYQNSIRNNQDWEAIFETKRKIWQALTLVFGLTLIAFSLVILEAFRFI